MNTRHVDVTTHDSHFDWLTHYNKVHVGLVSRDCRYRALYAANADSRFDRSTWFGFGLAIVRSFVLHFIVHALTLVLVSIGSTRAATWIMGSMTSLTGITRAETQVKLIDQSSPGSSSLAVYWCPPLRPTWIRQRVHTMSKMKSNILRWGLYSATILNRHVG
jgi:hypothetical protein